MLELLAKESNALLADAKSSMKNVPAGLHINAMWSYYRYPIGTANAYVPALIAIGVLDIDSLAIAL